MAYPEWFFNEVGDFTTYMLIPLTLAYLVTYIALIRQLIIDWRKKRK